MKKPEGATIGDFDTHWKLAIPVFARRPPEPIVFAHYCPAPADRYTLNLYRIFKSTTIAQHRPNIAPYRPMPPIPDPVRYAPVRGEAIDSKCHFTKISPFYPQRATLAGSRRSNGQHHPVSPHIARFFTGNEALGKRWRQSEDVLAHWCRNTT